MKVLSTLMIITGLVALALTNSGLWSLDGAYLQRYSESLPEPDTVTAFVDVTVLPMDGERALEDQTVLVRDGVIASIGSRDEVRVPPGAQVIDGRGKYLMPGLVDMHVHVMYDNDLLLFAANGVTRVRNMWGMTGMKLSLGFPDQLVLREAIAAGELFGPAIYTTGPVMEGEPNPSDDGVDRDPDKARASVAAKGQRVRLDQGVRPPGARRFTRRSWKRLQQTACRSSATCPCRSAWRACCQAGSSPSNT